MIGWVGTIVKISSNRSFTNQIVAHPMLIETLEITKAFVLKCDAGYRFGMKNVVPENDFRAHFACKKPYHSESRASDGTATCKSFTGSRTSTILACFCISH
jgi:hypothetical protein